MIDFSLPSFKYDHILETLRNLPTLELLIIAVISILIAFIVSNILNKIFNLRKMLENLEIRSSSARNFHCSIILLVASLLTWYGVFLFIKHPLQDYLAFAMQCTAVIGITWFVIALWDVFLDHALYRAKISTKISRQTETIILPFSRKLIRTFVLIISGLVILSIFRVNVAGLVAALGIGGLVLSFAAKDSIENLFGSLTIVLDMPFGVGDWVKIGVIEGSIEEINMRSTKIRTIDDSLITLPNGNLVKTAVENFGLRRFRRIRFILQLDKEIPPITVIEFTKELRQLLDTHTNTFDEGIHARLYDVTIASLEILVIAAVEAKEYKEELRIREDIIVQTLNLAKKYDIQLAKPVIG